jgi:hypothetical protein
VKRRVNPGWGLERLPRRRGRSRAMKPCTGSAQASSRGEPQGMSLLGTGSSPGCPGWPQDERSPSLSWCSKQFLRRYRVKAYVTEQGRVEEVQVEQSAGHPDLDRSAIEAVGR